MATVFGHPKSCKAKLTAGHRAHHAENFHMGSEVELNPYMYRDTCTGTNNN